MKTFVICAVHLIQGAAQRRAIVRTAGVGWRL